MQGQILKAVWPHELCAVPCQTQPRACGVNSIPDLRDRCTRQVPHTRLWELSCNLGAIHATCVALSTELVFL